MFLLTYLQEWFAVFRLPVTALNQSQLWRLGGSHLVNLLSEVSRWNVVRVEQAERLYLKAGIVISCRIEVVAHVKNCVLTSNHILRRSRNYHLLSNFVIKSYNTSGHEAGNGQLFFLEVGVVSEFAQFTAWKLLEWETVILHLRDLEPSIVTVDLHEYHFVED